MCSHPHMDRQTWISPNLERGAPKAGVGTQAARVDTARDCRSICRLPSGGQPVAGECACARHGSVAGQAETHRAAHTHRRPTTLDPRVLIPWGRSRWISGPMVDLCAGGNGDLGGMRRLVPQGPCLAGVEDLALDAADAHPTSGPARGSADRAVAHPGLARAQKRRA
jgi:hypothetical protein